MTARPALALIAALVLAACASDDPDASDDPGATDERADARIPSVEVAFDVVGRVDLQPTGNRVVEGTGELVTAEPTRVELGVEPAWIVPVRDGTEVDGVDVLVRSWLVAGADGALVLVGDDGAVIDTGGVIDPAAGPPLSVDGEIVSSPDPRLHWFDDPLPDSRVVFGRAAGQDVAAALVSPSTRYPHGVLGDEVEALAVEVRAMLGPNGPAGEVVGRIDVAEPDVIEAISPMFADLDADGDDDVLVTLSNSDEGARLAAFEVDGEPLADSVPIGTGNRWRNLLAVAPVGPDGELEVIDIRTPHIGGTLQFFRLGERDGMNALVRTSRAIEFSTHAIGSRNLDLGIVGDAAGDARLDIIVPTQDRRTLVAVRRHDDGSGVETVGSVDLGARMTTNLAAEVDEQGRVSYAVGTSDGAVLIWGS